ncbi:MAG: DUF424 family protein [Candidatus Aenigmarchaeota archaeon]|nr:DUF424 family protein [Candidatus Aenigmarchaeota archaeon]
MKFAYKYFSREKLLAVCDKELLGEKLKFEETEFEVKKSFYFEKIAMEKEIEKMLDKAKTINLIGNKIIEIAVKMKLIGNDNVMKIEGISHIQIYKI